jgi:general secretion pathway protein B
MLKLLKVNELSPGMMVTQVIQQNGPVKIRKIGFIRSIDMIKGLTEMGVTVVEVDIAQSLNIEVDDDDSVTAVAVSADNKPAKLTATQRLVASSRHIADADSRLSQQFHRSLFLPALDQMPSKWLLYGKPYTLLTVFIACGFLLGTLASYSSVEWLASMKLDSSAQQSTATSATADALLSTGIPIASNVDSTQQGLNDEENNVVANKTRDDNAATTNRAPSVEAPLTVKNRAQETAQAIAKVTSLDTNSDTAGNTNSQPQPSKPPAVVNGITLEAGQQVLGYQSGSDDSTNSVQLNDSNVVSTPNSNVRDVQSLRSAANDAANIETSAPSTAVNRDLLRRAKAAAQTVDEQASDPKPELIRVTDLNALPRIDQLSPAILTQMPAMSFSAHMYASNPRDRWVRVNSMRLGEGEVIANNVVLKRIESEKVVLEYNGKEFTMNALSDW